ncbi:hypothetical protein QEH42_gp083 [Microbacterium phage Pumpernickel]|uniref:Uncharacterized protein n=1 Tax=Microbacterium phage Pumpernickel TaxID=2885983 RepID=A0AAE9C3E9_9CAUD|nr:hypothetical protein QEH42_gp083 [Microbacterium phage Pumpernickel]UDL15874.1 hypothetical protein SEA_PUMPERNICKEL_83 [Microbacterium phage Pumpernickel]
MATDNKSRIWTGLGVLVGGPEPLPIESIRSTEAGRSITAVSPEGEETTFRASKLNIERNSGRIVFTSNRVLYQTRELRETDGQWLSAYQIDLPLEAVESLMAGAPRMAQESIIAYASDDSPYVLGVVYKNGESSWVRSDGDWLLIAEGDDTYQGMEAINIGAEEAEEFLDLYDRNFVTVSDAQKYESAESFETSDVDVEEDDSDE